MSVKTGPDLIGNVYAACNDAWSSYSTMTELESMYGAPVNADGTINTDWARNGYDLYMAYCSKNAYATMGKTSSSDQYYQKTVYDEYGNITGGHVVGYYGGTSLLVCGETSTVEISTDQSVYDMDAGQRTAQVTVQPTIVAEGNYTSTTVYIHVTIPADLEYDPGSAYWGDTAITPDINVNADGSSVLTFALENVNVGEALSALTFSCTIGHAGTSGDVYNNESVSLTAEIESLYDHRAKQASNGNVSSTSFNIIKLSSTSISKSVDNYMIELNGGFTWTLNFYNGGSSDEANTELADVFPKNNDSNQSVFSGNYSITGIDIDFSSAPNTYEQDHDSIDFWVSNNYDGTIDDLVLGGVPEGWHDLITSKSDDSVTHIITLDITGYEHMAAFYFDLGNMDAGETVTIHIQVETEGNEPGDVYRNVFCEASAGQNTDVRSNMVSTQVVERDISGRTWVDANKNGIQDDGEPALKNVTVTLYQDNGVVPAFIRTLAESGAKDVYGNDVEPVKTDETGAYIFTNLLAGTYRIEFSGVNGYIYQVTEENVGTNDQIDSDAKEVSNDNGNLVADIQDVGLPEIEDMDRYQYSSDYNDAGYSYVTVDIEGNKEWDDADDQYGLRPGSITICLLADGEQAKDENGNDLTATITAADDWEFSFKDLLKNTEDGKEIEYTVTEEKVNGYTGTRVKNNDGTFTITNTLDTVDVEGSKTWDDEDDTYKNRPESITIHLLADGTEMDSVTVTEKDNWAWSFTGLPKYKSDGVTEVEYTITEDTITGYDTTVNGYDLTNTLQTTSITAIKVWNDDNNRDGLEKAVNVQLKANDKLVGDEFTLDDGDNWSHTWEDLPVYYEGEEIQYEVEELTELDGYDVTSTLVPETDDAGNETGNYIAYVVNTHENAETKITVNKVWQDAENENGTRPENVTVQLLADDEKYGEPVTLDSGNNWNYTWDDLYAFNQGTLIQYTVEETAVKDYTTSVSELVPVYDDDNNVTGFGITVTNTRTGETEVSVEKNWVDNNNAYKTRPESITATITGSDGNTYSLNLNDQNNWSATQSKLPLYDGSGEKITYTVTEESVDSYETDTIDNKDGTFTITNTLTGETEVSVMKEWDDHTNDFGLRPDSIEVTIKGSDGNTYSLILNDQNGWSAVMSELPKYDSTGTEIVYEVMEEAVIGYTGDVTQTEPGIFTITNTMETVDIHGYKTWNDNDNANNNRPEYITIRVYADGSDTAIATAVTTAADNWKWEIAGLPKYNKDGTEVSYVLVEDAVTGYTTKTGDLIADEDGNYSAEITNTEETIQVAVVKEWDDADDQDGKRPASVTVHLLADGEPALDKDGEAITATLAEDNGWAGTFENLPKYKNRAEIQYSISEDAVNGYSIDIESTKDEETGNYTITIVNSHTPEKTGLSGVKEWDDEDDQDGKRPVSVTVHLMADDEPALDEKGEPITATVTEQDEWEFSFSDLPKYKNGTEIQYSITEDDVTEYTTEITVTRDESTGGFMVTLVNSHTPEVTSLNVIKVWNDDDNRDGVRPEIVQVLLKADGKQVGDTVTLYEKDGWEYTWNDLPVYAEGKEITYTVEEDEVPDSYTMSGGDALTPVTDDDGNVTGYLAVLVNTHEDAETNITVYKKWQDDDNAAGARPKSVTVQLLANDEACGDPVTLSGDDWSYTWDSLYAFDHGTLIQYTVEETAVEGYTSVVGNLEPLYDDDNNVTGFGITITNTRTGKTEISAEKKWIDNDNAYGTRPESITLTITGSDESTYTMELGEANEWKSSLELPQYTDQGVEITYVVTEPEIENYESDFDDHKDGTYTITNTLTGKTNVSVTKEWVDNNNAYNTRPDSITMTVTGSDESKYTLTLSEGNDWKDSLELPMYTDQGVKITYAVTEPETENYKGDLIDHEDGTYTITNTLTGETSVSVSKEWRDNNDLYSIRPASVTAVITGTDGSSHTIDLSNDNSWSAVLSGLPLYDPDGVMISYDVDELSVNGYDSEVTDYGDDTFSITNTLKTIDINGTKIWDDAQNQDGKRPTSITVNLLQNGIPIDSQVIEGDEDDDTWVWSFTGLPQQDASGAEYTYTVTEDTVEDYTTAIDGYTITNTHNPGKSNINVQKVWVDGDDQDGERPEEITVNLLKNGKETDATLTLNEENGWDGTFTDLDEYTNGVKNEYDVAEVAVDDYETEIEHQEGTTSFVITNTHRTYFVGVEGSKVWNDDGKDDSRRPDSITVNLYRYDDKDQTESTLVDAQSVTPANDGSWSWKFDNLPKYHDHGTEYVYFVKESSVNGYETVVSDPDFDYETGIYSGTITNTALSDLSITKEVSGISETEEYEFEILLTRQDGTPFNGDVSVTYSDNKEGILTFENGKAAVSLKAGETVRLKSLAYGTDCTVTEITTGADTVTVYVGDEAVMSVSGKENEVSVDVGTINYDTQVRFVNAYRGYFPIDEEIVPDYTDRNTWVKEEAVNEYNAIEIEMSTTLPVITGYELANGNFTMNFHEVLDSQLVLDEVNSDFLVFIGGNQIDHQYYTITLASDTRPLLSRLFRSGNQIDDGCTFHVDVDLTALYRDGVITEDDLQGDTEIIIFFFADLEGTGLNGSYTSTVWYDIYDGEDWQYTSNEDVVEVYTYEIDLIKYDASTFDGTDYDHSALAGATFGVYYDKDATDPVSRNQEPYTATSGEDGKVIFYGLADGTYYVKETEAPTGYALSDEVLEIVLDESLIDSGHAYEGVFADNPLQTEISGSKIWDDSDDQDGRRPESITIRLWADGEEIDSKDVTAADGWAWSFTDLNLYANGQEIAYTVTEDKVNDYTTEYDADNNTITNSYTPEETSLTVFKVWADDNDLDGLRPDEITVTLIKNGEATDQTLTLSQENSWIGTFSGLDEYESGEKIAYTVEETEIPEGYEVSVTGDAASGYTITNTHKTEVVTSPGTENPPTAGNPDKGSPNTGNPDTGNPDSTNSANGGKTGDVNLTYLWILLMIAGAAFVVAGVTRWTRPREDK